jgi:hypothetical protein
MAQAGQRQANIERRTSINYKDMGQLALCTSCPVPLTIIRQLASTTQQYQEFMFLQGPRSTHNSRNQLTCVEQIQSHNQFLWRTRSGDEKRKKRNCLKVFLQCRLPQSFMFPMVRAQTLPSQSRRRKVDPLPMARKRRTAAPAVAEERVSETQKDGGAKEVVR